MSKEQEARQQRTVPPTVPNPNPQSAATAYVYNPTEPGTYAVPPPVGNQIYGGHGFCAPGPRSKKSVIEAYILFLTLGLLGAHHFYLKRPGWGALYIFTFGLGGFGWLIDLFRLAYLVKLTNKRDEDGYKANKKNISDAYTLWFPFGIFGFHHFYLNKPGFGVLYLFTLGGFGIGWLIDLCRIPYLVKAANEEPDNAEKQVGTAYALCMSPLGILGCHHFYLKRPVFGLVYFFTFGLFGIGWIVDWFRIPVLVKRANKDIAVGDDGKKHLDDAYLLWLPLGLIGAHHFYLRRPVWGVLYLLTFGLCGVGWLIDGCRMPCLVKEVNKLYKEKKRFQFVRNNTSYIDQGVVIRGPGNQQTGGYGAALNTPQPNQYPQYPHQQQQQQQQQQLCPQQLYPQMQPHQQEQQFPQPPAYQQHNEAFVPDHQSPEQPQTVPSYSEKPPPYSRV